MKRLHTLSLLGLVGLSCVAPALHAQYNNNGAPYYEYNGRYYYYDNAPYQQGASDPDPYPSTVPYDTGGFAGYTNYDNDSGGVEANDLFDSYDPNNN